VTLKIFNMLEQEVATVLNHQEMDEGTQEIEYNASMLPSGVYFYRLEVSGLSSEGNVQGEIYTQLRKMLLIK
jgi:hypothetical protein